jgi:hypothetical protein
MTEPDGEKEREVSVAGQFQIGPLPNVAGAMSFD